MIRRPVGRPLAIIAFIGALVSLDGCDTAASDAVPRKDVAGGRVAAACQGMGGRFIANADTARTFGPVTVVLPGANWCERPEGPAASMFYNFATIIAWSREGHVPTPSERAQTYFLVAAGVDPPLLPTEAPPRIEELREMLEADLRDGLAGGTGSIDRPRLLAWEHGPRFRTLHAEVGATLRESNCVPTRIILEDTGNPLVPAGTTLRLTSNSRYCLAPADSGIVAFAFLRASERRVADDADSDPRSAEWNSLVERYFASLRFGPPPNAGTRRP